MERLNRYIDQKEAAAITGFTVWAFEAWRCRGGGPKYFKVRGKRVRYRLADVIAWMESHAYVSNTSEEPVRVLPDGSKRVLPTR
jgi:hypothetical protein